jgi:hypothetical protein
MYADFYLVNFLAFRFGLLDIGGRLHGLEKGLVTY